MDTFSYKTVQSVAEGFFSDKGSKFMGYIFPLDNEDDFKIYLKKIKAVHAGARHFCYAYRLGTKMVTERSNDDGEPSGTAGKPILNQLLSAGITQAGIIVVRYFGGTLLGTSGLIKAYKGAAKSSIENAVIIEKPITTIHHIEVSYNRYNDYMNLFKKFDIAYITTGSTDDSTTFKIEIPVHIEATFMNELNHLMIP